MPWKVNDQGVWEMVDATPADMGPEATTLFSGSDPNVNPRGSDGLQDWEREQLRQRAISERKQDMSNTPSEQGAPNWFKPATTAMPGLPTGPVMPGTQPKNVMPGQPNNPYDDTPISPWDRFTNWVDYTNNFAKNNKYWTGNPNPSSQSPSQWWTANAPSETAKPSWWNGTPNSEMPVVNPALKTQSREGGLPTNPSVTNPTNGFAPTTSGPSLAQSDLFGGTGYGGYTFNPYTQFTDAQKSDLATKLGHYPTQDDLAKADAARKSVQGGGANGTNPVTGGGVTFGGANNNYFRDLVLSNPSASDSDAAYQAALKGGFQGTMNDWLITKDAILHNANRGNSGYSGNGGNGGGGGFTPPTTETNPFTPSTWTPRPWQSDKGILKFDEQDWSTIPAEVRPFVDSLLRAKGWTPTGQYGLYGAIEYKYGGNAPSNIWFDSTTFDGMPDNVKKYLQNLFAQKGWTTTPTATTTTA